MDYNSFSIFGFTMLLGAGTYLFMYLINKLNSDMIHLKKQNESTNNRCIYIIRRLPSLNLDEKIKEYIKKIEFNAKYRILTTDTYRNSRVPEKQSMLYSLVYKRFLQKLFKKDDNIVIMNRNLFHWEYDNYYLLAKSLNIPVKIVEFTTDKKISQDNIHLFSQFNLEQKLFQYDPRTNEIIKL
jgi:hypothetical protein